MNRLRPKYIIFFLFALATNKGFSQGTYITVLDKKTREPVPFAHVLFETIDGQNTEHEITNLEGKAINRAKSQTNKVTVTFVGFETFEGEIRPGESRTFYLKPEIFNVGETVVTGQYTPQKVDQSIYKVQVIGAKQIEERGANNLAELLSGESNIQIQQDGVLGTSLKMQGMTGENVKILVDGVPVIGRLNGNIDLDQIDLSNVEHIEIVEGPMSVVYGTNALAGTINIITKKNTRNKLRAGINGYYETVGVYNFDGNASVMKNNHSLALTGGRKMFQGYKFNPENRIHNYKPKEQYNGSLSYLYNGKNDLVFRINSSLFQERTQHLDSVITIVRDRSSAVAYTNDKYFITRRLTNNLNFNTKINDRNFVDWVAAYSWYARMKHAYYKDHTTLEEYHNKLPALNDTTIFNTIMSRGFISHVNPDYNYEVQLGMDINIDQGKGARIVDTADARLDDYAAFISGKYHFPGNSSIQPGVRFIHNTKFEAPVIPSINIMLSPFAFLNFRASYAKGFRAPSLKELYINFEDVNHDLHGNLDLMAETSDSYNASIEFNFDSLKHTVQTEASFFYNKGENVIEYVHVPDSGDIYYVIDNIDYRETLGGRLNINYNFYPRFTLKTGFSVTGVSQTLTFTDSTVTPTDTSYFENTFLTDFQYTKDFNINLSYNLYQYDLLFSVFYKYNGKTTALYTDADSESGEVVSQYIVNPYHTLDFTVTKNFYNKRLTMVVGAKNLFNNKEIQTTSGYNPETTHGGGSAGSRAVGWGRTMFVKLSYKFIK